MRELEARGVAIAACDLTGPEDDLVKQLTGIDVVLSPIVVEHLLDQIPLANAAKKAGVKRFVPSFFATVMPPRGAMWFHDQVGACLLLCPAWLQDY